MSGLLCDMPAHEGGARACVFSPDSQLLVTGGADRLIHVWSTAEWSIVATFSGHERGIIDLCLCADGARLISSAADAEARIWSFPTGEALGTRPSVRASVCAPDGETIASWRGRNHVSLWNVMTDEEERRFSVCARLCGFAFTPDGKQLLVAPAGEDIEALDLESLECVETIASDPEEVTELALSASPRRLLVAGVSGRIEMHEGEGWQEAGVITLRPGQTRTMSLSAGGRLLAVGGERRVRIFDLVESDLRADWAVAPTGVHDVAISPNGKWLAMVASDGRLRAWEIPGRMAATVRLERERARQTGPD